MKDNLKTLGFSFEIQLLLDYWQIAVAWEALKRVSRRSTDEARKKLTNENATGFPDQEKRRGTRTHGIRGWSNESTISREF